MRNRLPQILSKVAESNFVMNAPLIAFAIVHI